MRLQTLTHRLIFPFTRHIYHRADAIVVYGKHVKQYLISEGVPEERIFIAAHAVENEAYRHKISRGEKEDLLRELGIQPDQKVILYLGRLEEDKGLSYLLEAFASLSRDDTVLLLAGTGTKRERLIQLARNKGILNHVRFPGYIDPDKTVFYYALAYVFVLPSITMPFGKEPWGLVINEAMNQGVPVIATESVGAAAGGLVKNGENGFVIPERDSNALSHTLSVCLNNAALRDRLGNNAKEDIKYWDNKRMVKGFRNAIEYTMNRK
jgi:glycosyltransferase involved in cell wall biosynthesis